ncbi:pyridoxamine 5'-phosphate oxidase family protein [Streptomyces sp. NPDC046977]|uniref:pyridoxamine 5'-phosphate oxidase family protein n=1 Tax=Streptomyces sp. NPDC046977 TaxID=3154703 RepID=UPI0033E51D64
MAAEKEPEAELDARYSSDGADPTSWSQARRFLADAEIYWLTTVRPDGRPHVTPLIGVWYENALHFSTGADERKARNLVRNAKVVLTTGNNALHEGLDVVVEGEAARVRSDTQLRSIAEVYEAKYGEEWRFEVHGEVFRGEGGNEALVYEVEPRTAFAYGRGTTYSQTRWLF